MSICLWEPLKTKGCESSFQSGMPLPASTGGVFCVALVGIYRWETAIHRPGGKYGTTASVTRCAVETCASSCHLLRAVGSVAGHEVETVVPQSPKGAMSVDVAWS